MVDMGRTSVITPSGGRDLEGVNGGPADGSVSGKTGGAHGAEAWKGANEDEGTITLEAVGLAGGGAL